MTSTEPTTHAALPDGAAGPEGRPPAPALKRALLAFAVALPLGLGAEIFTLLELVIAPKLDALHLLTLLGLHLFSAVALAEGMALRYAPGDAGGQAAWRLALLLAFGLPLFGALLVTVLLLRPPRTVQVKLDDFVSPMEYRKQQAEAKLAAEASRGVANAGVDAIGEALKDADRDTRLGAVEALRALENREAVALLGQSLQNTVFEVRYHAVEALAGINKKHSDRIAQASAAVDRDPSPASLLALADVFHEYAALEAEEESIQQHLYRSTVANYREAISKGAELTLSQLLSLAAAQIRVGALQEAWHSYQAALVRDPDSYAALLGVAELQFRRGRFDQLRQTCQRMLNLPAREITHHEVLRLWVDPSAALAASLGLAGDRR